jgi:thiol-disulfide isomerase/thioredoxin
MKRPRLTPIALLAASLCLVQAHSIELGDPAPPLKISEWVKGDALDLAKVKGKKTVVVEFWATWCGPCRTSIPHLTELQRKFKDKGVVVIGVSNEKVSDIRPFTDKMGDKMDYTVAADENSATSEGYMTAFKQNGIPHAFIVDKEGRIVWHGHPMAGLDTALDEVLAGKFNLEKARQRSTAEGKLQEYYRLLATGEDDAKLPLLEQELTALDQKLGGINPGQKFDPADARKRMSFNRLIQSYQKAFSQDPESAKVQELEQQMRAAAPPGFDVADYKQQLGAQIAFMAYMQEATGEAAKDKLAKLGQRLETSAGTNATVLNQIAWIMLTDENLKQRDVALATRLAKTAYDACAGKEPSIVDTYARALFDSGKMTEAIQMQKQALALCDDDTLRKTLEENLKAFEAKATRP